MPYSSQVQSIVSIPLFYTVLSKAMYPPVLDKTWYKSSPISLSHPIPDIPVFDIMARVDI
jgi:hypothetical protein